MEILPKVDKHISTNWNSWQHSSNKCQQNSNLANNCQKSVDKLDIVPTVVKQVQTNWNFGQDLLKQSPQIGKLANIC